MITHFKRNTNNWPIIELSQLHGAIAAPYLKTYDDPCWEIYTDHSGNVEVWACRPTNKEVMEGDLLGSLGTIIELRTAVRWSMGNARWLARKLLNCDPIHGIVIPRRILNGIKGITTAIPIYVTDGLDPNSAAHRLTDNSDQQ